MILEPNLHLSGRQIDFLSQLLPFGRRQVALAAKASLQRKGLSFREQNATFSLPFLPLAGRLRLVVQLVAVWCAVFVHLFRSASAKAMKSPFSVAHFTSPPSAFPPIDGDIEEAIKCACSSSTVDAPSIRPAPNSVENIE